MKRILLIAMLLMLIFLCGCEESVQNNITTVRHIYGDNDILSVVEMFGNYTLLVDEDTNVLYVTNHNKGSIEVLLNADGTPKLLEVE